MARGKSTKKKEKNMKTIFVIVIVGLVLAFVLFMTYQKPVVEDGEIKPVKLLPPAYPNPTAEPSPSPKLDELFLKYSEQEGGLAQIAPRPPINFWGIGMSEEMRLYYNTRENPVDVQNTILAIGLINQARAEQNLSPLEPDLEMTMLAAIHANFLLQFDNDDLPHSDNDVVANRGGLNVVQLVYDIMGGTPENSGGFGETLHGYSDPYAVIIGDYLPISGNPADRIYPPFGPHPLDGWLNHPGHMEMMLNSESGKIGLVLIGDPNSLTGGRAVALFAPHVSVAPEMPPLDIP